MQRRLSHLGAVLLLSAIAGCATVKPGSGTAVPADLAELDKWQAHGRLGVSGPDSGGSGSFDWQQRGDRADIRIRGPVGVGSVRLQLHGGAENPELRMELANGQTLESEAAWHELEARLGASVPAGSLRYWMLGVAAPGEHRWHEPAPDGTATLEQAGWRIDYQRYSDDAGARVPVKFRAVSGDAKVRIVVDRWQLGQ